MTRAWDAPYSFTVSVMGAPGCSPARNVTLTPRVSASTPLTAVAARSAANKSRRMVSPNNQRAPDAADFSTQLAGSPPPRSCPSDKAYAKQAQDRQLEVWAAEIRLRAERRAGELLRDTERAQGQRTDLVPQGNEVATPTLSELGVSRKESMTWQLIAKVPGESSCHPGVLTNSEIDLAAWNPVWCRGKFSRRC